MGDVAPAPAVAFERDDIELIKLFLSRYKDAEGHSYAIESRPETTERKEKAIEAVAVAKCGKRLAIEHTKIQPFEGQKADDVPFLTVFEQLETDTSLRVKDTLIEIYVRAGAVPKGIVWKELAPKVREWFAKARESFPPEGQVSHDIPDLGFTLSVCVQTMQIPGTEGLVNIGRTLPFGNSFIDVLRKALANKVPKLVGTPAEQHILLLGDEGTAIGYTKITKGVDDSLGVMTELKKVDAVWCTHSMSWKSSGDVFFCHVWPGGVKERFWIKDKRFAGKKTASDN